MTEFRRVMSSRTADTIVRIMVIISVGVSSFAAYKWQDLTSCVAQYNDVSNQRAEILGEANERERKAERQADDAQANLFLSPILSIPSEDRTPAQRQQVLDLFAVYQKALAAQVKERVDADNARKQHPLPDPPKDVCG